MTLNRAQLRKLPSFVFLSLLVLPTAALAGEPTVDEPVGPEDENDVWMGNETEPCAWPSVVQVSGGGGLCTGSLIHPEIVLYAAHCGAQDKAVRFGDSQNSLKTKQVEYCKTYPGYNSVGTDWAYCKLAEPMFDIPITPVGFGCEMDQYYQNGREIALIGFGNNEGDSGSGRKRWGWTYISNATNNTLEVGGDNTYTVCSGDSGGPAMVRYDDQSWHVFGIASVKFDDTCSAAKGRYALARNAMQWVETDSGVDVTVCHDLQGNWDPTVYCGDIFNGEPALSYGAWNTWCQDATSLDWSSTCGPDYYSENYEENAPFLSMETPFDGQVFDGNPANFDIVVQAEDDSGLPVAVQIEIEGELQPQVVETNPAVFNNAVFPCGQYTITAHGTDFWGNEGTSLPATFEVLDGNGNSCIGGDGDGDPATGDGDGDPDPDTGGETTGSETTGEGGTTGFGGGPGFEVEAGCSCGVDDSGSRSGAAGWMLIGLGALGLRRRRRQLG